MQPLLRLSIKRFLCLDDVEVDLSPLSVLVGPNGSGKSALLDVIQFLGDSVREDLAPAIAARQGFQTLRFRGAQQGDSIEIGIEAVVTRHAHEGALDTYKVEIEELGYPLFRPASSLYKRKESFTFKRTRGAGRRLTIRGSQITIYDEGRRKSRRKLLKDHSLALSTLPRLATTEGGEQVSDIAELFRSFRVYDVDVMAARAASPTPGKEKVRLAQDASNLSAFLFSLSRDTDLFSDLLDDAREMIPGLKQINFRSVGGPEEAVVMELEERWLPGTTQLSTASFGTIRVLALLALLYDPNPPKLTCVEEIDHGLHPHLFDRLVELLRVASQRTQILIATHSPALVNRLTPEELIVCERNPETGGARIPAINPETVREMIDATDGRLGPGELWFSGSLGGVP